MNDNRNYSKLKSNDDLIMKNKKSRKYQQIIDTGRQLFMRYGIRRVSVEEICKTAGVSKMTFYNHFKNKVDLALYIIKKVMEVGEERYRNILALNIPYREKVKLMVQLKMDQTRDFSREMLEELWVSPYNEIKEFIEQKKRENFTWFIQDLNKAQEKGDIREDIKPEFILFILNHMITLLENENLAALYPATPELVMELTNFFFYGILASEQGKEKDHEK